MQNNPPRSTLRSVSSYWCAVVRVAGRRTLGVFGLGTLGQIVIRVLLFAIALAVLGIWGSLDASSDYVIERMAVFATIIGLVPIVFLWNLIAVPAGFAEEKAAEVSDLTEKIATTEEFKKPRMSLTEEPGGRVRRVELLWGNKNIPTLLMHVKNTSASLIEGARLLIVNYEDSQKEHPANIPCVENISGKDDIDIRPLSVAEFRIIGIFSKNATRQLRLGSHEATPGRIIPFGRYKLKLRAEAKNCQYITQDFLLVVSDEGKAELRLWEQGDAL